ncbi:hypothetical protein ABIF65_008186 [Bradyrhizobium japonicum]
MLFGRLVAVVLTLLWMPVADAQDFMCQPGQTRILGGGGYQCQCPDGTYANYLSPCPSSQKLPSIDFESAPSTPKVNKLQAAQQRIREIANAVRRELLGGVPLSSSIANQPTTIAPPRGYSASFEQQPKTPSASGQPNDLLNKSPIAAMPPLKQSTSPNKSGAANCGAGQRPSAQGTFCELDPNQSQQNRPAQSAPKPTGSYATCIALSSNTGAFATNSQSPTCMMADGYTYYKDGRSPTR